MNEPLLRIEHLRVYFPVKGGFFPRKKAWVRAVDDVDLELAQGQVLGVVGESGCGKTTLVNGLLQLEKVTSGRVLFQGEDLCRLPKKTMRSRRRELQIVFQDPFWSLDPRLLVRDIVGEPLKVHLRLSHQELVGKVQELLEMVGIAPEAIFRYPHEFSGGLRQRIAIARALALRPKLVILDEPTSAIDVVSQTQILSLLKELREQLELAYILISHDLSVVAFMADHIAVMYLGKVVERGAASRVFSNPRHPYTRALFDAIPAPGCHSVEALVSLRGAVPSAVDPPSGCRFHTRCPVAFERCSMVEPPLAAVGDAQMAACWLVQ